jgi:diaminopimelate decarboxylase
MNHPPAGGYNPEQRLALFPLGTHIENGPGGEHLMVASHDLADLADRHGTPLYVYDQVTMDAAVDSYRGALATYPGPAGITYAAKAFLCLAMAQWAEDQDLWLDCTGVGELAIASAAGVGRNRILVHGVNKGPADLQASLSGAGTLVVDSLAEVERLLAVAAAPAATPEGPGPDVWLRLRPGFPVDTHAHRQTGQEDSKFGMGPQEIREAVHRFRAASPSYTASLPLTGLHFHQGSHFRDPAPTGAALDVALDLVASLRAETGWLPRFLCPGGGWAVAYHQEELPHPPIRDYVDFIVQHLIEGCRRRSLPLPHLQLEPGRSLVAQAGVALYRVGATKSTTGRRWLLLDGGLADNIRPALYGARYSALPVWQPRRPGAGPAWLAGPYCESGDVLIQGLPLADVQPGELLAVPMSGAYHLSMSSNYNGACRPAVAWLRQDGAHLVREREQPRDLYRRDRPLPPEVEQISYAR